MRRVRPVISVRSCSQIQFIECSEQMPRVDGNLASHIAIIRSCGAEEFLFDDFCKSQDRVERRPQLMNQLTQGICRKSGDRSQCRVRWDRDLMNIGTACLTPIPLESARSGIEEGRCRQSPFTGQSSSDNLVSAMTKTA